MNAYELADELRKHGLNGDNHGLFNKRIQNMLRQQANELDKVVPQLVKANGLIENLRLRIAELEKKSEPVAWTWFSSEENTSPYTQMTGYTTECWSRSKPDEFVKIDEGTLMPLYTSPQTKPLSDEEIKQIWYNLYPLSSSSYWDDKREGLAELKFARAIEAKVRGQ